MNKKYQRSVFEWDHFCVYLAGPVDLAEDGGVNWRLDWTEKLVSIGFLRNNIFSPTKKPIKNTAFDLDNEATLMQERREEKDWDGLVSIVSQIAHVDLRLVDKSDVVVAYFPKDKEGRTIRTYGTIHEIVNARQQKKPVFLVWDGGKEECSAWMMWLVGHRNVFSSFEEMSETLVNISNGKEYYNAKDWLLIDFNKKNKEEHV